MNEAQGVTPAGTSKPYKNLPEALRAHRIPIENHEFITAIVQTVGATSLIDRGRYIEAIRSEGANLHIGRTYTNGFTEDETIVIGAAPLRLQASEGRAPYFYVDHPSQYASATTKARSASRGTRTSAPKAPAAPKRTAVEERNYGVCDVCFMTRTASGSCNCD